MTFASNPVRHTVSSMDEMIRAVAQHRQNLFKAGHLDHFGQPVQRQQLEAGQQPDPVTHKGYCMKCRTKVDAQTEGVVDNGEGRPIRTHGSCPTCGTKVHTMMTNAEGKKLKDALESTRAQTGGVI